MGAEHIWHRLESLRAAYADQKLMGRRFNAYDTVTCAACGAEREVPTGAALKAARLAAGVKQCEAARHLNVQQSLLSKIENGTRRPSPAIIDHYRTFLKE